MYFSMLKDFLWFPKPNLNNILLAQRYISSFSFHEYIYIYIYTYIHIIYICRKIYIVYENIRHESGHSKKGGKFLCCLVPKISWGE